MANQFDDFIFYQTIGKPCGKGTGFKALNHILWQEVFVVKETCSTMLQKCCSTNSYAHFR